MSESRKLIQQALELLEDGRDDEAVNEWIVKAQEFLQNHVEVNINYNPPEPTVVPVRVWPGIWIRR